MVEHPVDGIFVERKNRKSICIGFDSPFRSVVPILVRGFWLLLRILGRMLLSDRRIVDFLPAAKAGGFQSPGLRPTVEVRGRTVRGFRV